MTSNPGFHHGNAPRGAPSLRRLKGRRPVVLAALALAALSLAGCQSDPCRPGPCNGLFSGWGNGSPGPLRQLGARVFGPRPAPCCDGAIGGTVAPVPFGGTVVTPAPGVITTPGGSTTTTPELDPIPSGTPGPPPASSSTPSTGSKSSTGKATYEALRSPAGPAQARVAARDRGNLLARGLSSTPEPTPRSALGSGEAAGAVSGNDSSPRSTSSALSDLDDLPPLDLPSAKVTESSTPPAPQPPDRESASSAPPSPTPVADTATSAAPGIRRFAGVESKLAGGSLPDAAGLNWLFEKGYRTILDLRETPENSATFIADVDRIGLRYVALPITLKTLDAHHIARFHAELAQAEARPLFFCDGDGTRAGALWYIHKITVDHVDPLVARREAEELGLKEGPFWNAVTAYLESIKPAPASRPVAMTSSAPESKLAEVPPASPAPAVDDGSNAPPPPSAGPSPAADESEAESEARNEPAPRETPNWRPLAALVVTGVAAPLAYLTTSAIPSGVRALARASLPGPARPRKSLPG